MWSLRREETLDNIAYHKVKEKGSKTNSVVLGIGNLLIKDEGVGVHVAHVLQDRALPDNLNFRVVDGGTSPDILHLVNEADRIIIIDAVHGGGTPGAIYRFKAEDITAEDYNFTSLHQVGLLESLNMMRCIGERPKDVVIIGVETKEIGWGLELSPELEEKIPQIVNVVLQEVGKG